MSDAPRRDLGALSLDEKRSLLRKLLEGRASAPDVTVPAPGQPRRVPQMLHAPEGRAPDARVERRSPRRRREAAGTRPVGGVRDEEIWERTNLTKNQFLVWAGQQLQPGVPLYNITALFTIPGPVDRAHFQIAFQALVAGSDALRTVIEEVDGLPRQRVLPRVSYVVEGLDFSQTADPEARLRAWAAQRAQEPFDLTVRLFEAALVKLAEDRFVWLFKHHHLISDAWTIALCVRYATEFYRRSRAGTLDASPTLPPYQAFVAYEREQRNTPLYLKAKAYWQEKLAEEVEPLVLYGNTAPRRTPRVQRISHDLGLARSRALRALAASAPFATSRANLGLLSLFVGLFLTYLHRISGNRRLALGTPILNRPSRAFKDTLGLFMQFAPLRFTLEEGETFVSVIQKVKQELFEILRHQRYTTANPPQRRHYEVVFNYNNSNNPVGWHFDGATVSTESVHPAHENDALSLQVHDYDAQGSFVVDFDFHCDVFTPAQRQQTIQHFLRVVDAFCQDPARRLSQVDLLTAAERRHLLADLALTVALPPGAHTILPVWHEQARRTPEAAAVVFEEAQLTYRQLDQRANRLAHYLRARGVGPDVMVGLCLERSLDMVVALLGILKAGGAYVPLDANYPRARLAFMLRDAQVRVLVTQEPLLAALPDTETHVVCLDAEADAIARESLAEPVSGVTGANLAYVIYTSGSTGQPRGVMIAHQSLANALQAWEAAYALRSWASCHLQMASHSFDVFTGDLVRALCTGGTLVLCPPQALLAPAELYALMRRAAVDSAEFVPAVLKNLVQHLKDTGESLAFMRLLVAGSDNWPVGDHADVQALCGATTRLINSYGVTEATIDSLFFERDAGQLPDDSLVPIGRPFANTEVYVLDSQLHPAPLGMPGELYLGGAGLARGYRNRPELTAERFVPHPFSAMPGARVYRTGDRARFQADGTVEFLGRLDTQVKVRGFRVEVGEVESVLVQHPGVRDAVVQAREEPSGGKRLVAYVVAEGARLTIGELRGFAQGKLPEYMVPGAFVLLERMPLTPNGKVDRRALPAPEGMRPELGDAYVAPRTPVEGELARIWSEVLEVEPVGIHDDFLELGGHSLLAIQLLWRVRAAFQVELPLRELFETRTIAALALAVEQSRGRSRVSPIRAVPRDQELPLSFAQERLWFLDQLMPGHAFYNLSAAARITGPMDREALLWSLNEMVRRHEILRTTFATVEGRPVQVIAPALTLTVPVVDLTDRPPSGREGEIRRLADREAQRPFDLARGPLVRVGLLELGDEDHVLLATLHHIIADAWSTGVFIREMAALCSAFAKGEPSPLPALPLQYADFAAWQRTRLQGDVLAEQLAYWRQRLDGAPPVLELPTDRPRPPVQTYRGATAALEVSHRVSEAVSVLGRQEGVTLFMTLLAAFQAQLHRYSGQDDIVVGSPIANRDRTETEGLIGFFLNMLVLRTDLAGNPSFRELLGRVREVCLGAYAHQDLPFEKLVQEIHPERNLASEPLFQVALVLQNAPAPVIEIPGGLTVRLLDAANETARRDLTLVLWEGPHGLAGAFEYNTDLFDPATIMRMGGHFRAMLEGIVADPDTRLAGLPLLSAAERRQLLVEHNLTRTEYPRVAGLHESFEAQVERTPDAVAAIFEGQALTYAELNRRANRLAHYLSKRGIGPEVLVGICVNRSLPMLVALLGVLKAGGAYVPLSPASPKEHLRYMLDDAGVSLVLTEGPLLESLPDFAGQVVCLDTEAPVLGGEPTGNPISGVAPESSAYVIYTSGSTGRPKGVVIEHRQIRNYVFAVLDRLGLAGETVALVQPLTVDSSQTSIFPPLVTGGCLHVISEERALTPNALAEYFVGHPIDCLKIAPSHLAALLTADRPEHVLPRRRLIIGGEASQRGWVERLQALAPGSTIFNHYGPTEATVGVLTYRVAGGTTEIRSAVVPMGCPLPNTQAYVLDRRLEPLPIGVPGELYLGGECLGRGYLNHPELSAERFIPHPFSEEPGSRLYRTGDLARRLPDGSLEFLGRIDQQVKIRGFRIEPGEIEAVLRQHPAVREALVIAREESPGDKYLAAYLVGHEGPVPSGGELRRFVGLKLPGYMVPSAFVALDALPRTPHGKVDLRALPVPGQIRLEREKPQVPPRTPLEEELARLWSELLRVERIGIHDSFFELGGHSLLATQLASRIRAALRIELPLHRLFEAPTIAGLAEAIERERPGLPAPPITAVSRDAPLPLSFAQERLWFLDQLMPGHAFYNVPLAVRLNGPLDLAALDGSVTEIVRRHEVLRTTFSIAGDGPVQVIAPAARVTVPVVDLRGHDSARREAAAWELGRKEAEEPFDLARGPLFRITLLRLGDADHVLLLTLHHIITDGWSTGIFMHEVAVLYDAFSRGNPSPLPELPIQYGDFAHWQRRWLQGAVLDEHLDYWRHRLAGAPPLLELPTDHPRPAVQTFRGATLAFELPGNLGESLCMLGEQEGATPFMTLLAGFQALLSRYTGEEDIVVGAAIANRTRLEIETLIGFFVNMLVLRTDLSGNPSFRELVRRVREVCLGAFAHQDLPCEKLVETLQPERNLSHMPLAQVGFALQAAPIETLTTPNLTVSRLEVDLGTVKNDLALHMWRTGQGLHGVFEYSTDLFEAATIARMATHLRILLDGIVADPDRPLGDLPLASESGAELEQGIL